MTRLALAAAAAVGLACSSSGALAATIVSPVGVTLSTLTAGENLNNNSMAGTVYLFYEGTYGGVASYLLHYDRQLRDPMTNSGSFGIQLDAGESFGGYVTSTADLDASDPANGVTYPHGVLSARGLENATMFADTANVTAGNPVFVTFTLNTSVPARDEARFFINEGSVPEPGTWAMLLSGFGLVGAGFRRRHGRIAQAV